MVYRIDKEAAMAKKSFIGSIFGAMFRNALLKENKHLRLNHYAAGNIQERYAYRSTQARRRKTERRTRG